MSRDRRKSNLWRERRTNINTLSVIREVKLRPALWNKSVEQYKDKEARLQAWHEVSCAVVPNYTAMKSSDRISSDKAVRQRWRTARDMYIRSRTAPNKNYIYGDYLQFIDNTSIDKEDSLLALPSSSSSSDGTAKTEITKTEPNVKKTIIKRKEHNRVKYRVIRKQGMDVAKEELLSILQQSLIQMKDDNMAFFVSLLPIISKFSNSQRLEFRSHVLNAAIQISHADPLSIHSPSDSVMSDSSPFHGQSPHHTHSQLGSSIVPMLNSSQDPMSHLDLQSQESSVDPTIPEVVYSHASESLLDAATVKHEDPNYVTYDLLP